MQFFVCLFIICLALGCMDGFRINTDAEQKKAATNVNRPKPGERYIDDGSNTLRKASAPAPAKP